MFQDWQRTLTQSSVTVRKGPRQRMDVRFCEAGTTCREAYVRTAGFWQLRFYALLPARVRRIFFLDKRLTWRSANLTLPDYGRVARDSGVMSALILMSICCGPSRKDFSSGFSPRCDTKFIIYNSTGVSGISVSCATQKLGQGSCGDFFKPVFMMKTTQNVLRSNPAICWQLISAVPSLWR